MLTSFVTLLVTPFKSMFYTFHHAPNQPHTNIFISILTTNIVIKCVVIIRKSVNIFKLFLIGILPSIPANFLKTSFRRQIENDNFYSKARPIPKILHFHWGRLESLLLLQRGKPSKKEGSLKIGRLAYFLQNREGWWKSSKIGRLTIYGGKLTGMHRQK